MTNIKSPTEICPSYFLSNISNGTLLNCCRNSTLFPDVSSEFDYLDAVRQEWRDYLSANIESVTKNCGNWIDSWMMFLNHKGSTGLIKAT